MINFFILLASNYYIHKILKLTSQKDLIKNWINFTFINKIDLKKLFLNIILIMMINFVRKIIFTIIYFSITALK